MNYAVAVLALSAACVVWYLVQRAAGRSEDPDCESCDRPGCAARELRHPTCPEDSPPVPPTPPRLEKRSSKTESR